MRICRAHVKRFAKFFLTFLSGLGDWPNCRYQIYPVGQTFGFNDIGLSSKLWHNIPLYVR